MNSSTFLLYVSLFPLFILPVLLQFLSLCVQLTLFPVHFFVAVIFIQQLVPMTQILLSLYHSTSPASPSWLWLLFPFFLWIVLPPFFLILFPFSILFLLWFHSPPTVLIFPFCSIFLWSYLYHLFAFSLFHFYVPTNQCRLTYVNFALSVPFLSLLYLLPLAAFPLDCEQSLFCSKICKQEYLSSKVTCSLLFFFFLITNIFPLMPPFPLSFVLVPPLSCCCEI